MNVQFLHADPAALQQCRKDLEEAGITSKIFSSAVASVFALAFRGPAVAAVVCSYPMAGMRCEDFLQLCNNVAPGVPVILWTEDGQSESAKQGDLSGVSAVLQGPLTPENLISVLMRVMTMRPVHRLDSLHMI